MGSCQLPATNTYQLCSRCNVFYFIVDCSPHCMFAHVAQDNSYLRDLINLESATLSKPLLLFLESLDFPFSTFYIFHDGIYWRSSFWCCIPIWYGRRSRCCPTGPTGSTPTDARSIVTLSERSIPTPWTAVPLKFPWKSSQDGPLVHASLLNFLVAHKT